MADLDKALQTQLSNIQKKTGRTLAELREWLRQTGLAKHGELRDAARRGLGLGHGDANLLVTLHLRETGTTAPPAASPEAAVDEIYAGPKAALRPIHDAVMAAVAGMGPCEIAPKKGYLSLRRRKQFAMVGPATRTQVEVGLNARDLAGGERLVAQKPGGMCQYKLRLASTRDVDAEAIAWIRAAYDAAG